MRGNGEQATREEEQPRQTQHHSTTAGLSQELVEKKARREMSAEGAAYKGDGFHRRWEHAQRFHYSHVNHLPPPPNRLRGAARGQALQNKEGSHFYKDRQEGGKAPRDPS
ncbi:hypothetical protein BDA96_06G054500 [Sorghum bicolor]|uniref:Uncharacterized protein n=2 Tax=Sorghum bicolor TaxID=4558 RepID=A0A1B6PK77_SORBI|nr:hypothetical protein BDA96_06G054500 [Sorghum bicolor]KXG26085.1 hypothetical protein SORBI_3006G049000 [Sorghum bicolor]